jgi:hypothetical protein
MTGVTNFLILQGILGILKRNVIIPAPQESYWGLKNRILIPGMRGKPDCPYIAIL